MTALPPRTPFSTGSYLRARRLSQSIEIDNPNLELNAAVIEAIETDVREPTLAELGEIMFSVELDMMILTAIAHGGQAAIEASEECCRYCACSYSDPCQGDFGTCAWSDDFDGTCTSPACLEQAAKDRVAA